MPAKVILTDSSDLCKGVQHPLHGFVLRDYLLEVCKDKAPDIGLEFETAGGAQVLVGEPHRRPAGRCSPLFCSLSADLPRQCVRPFDVSALVIERAL